MSSRTSSFLGSMLTDSWSKISQDTKRELDKALFTTLTCAWKFAALKNLTIWTDGLSLPTRTPSSLLEPRSRSINYTLSLLTSWNSLRTWLTGTSDLTDQEWRVTKVSLPRTNTHV
jgi:hypothetical protein